MWHVPYPDESLNKTVIPLHNLSYPLVVAYDDDDKQLWFLNYNFYIYMYYETSFVILKTYEDYRNYDHPIHDLGINLFNLSD